MTGDAHRTISSTAVFAAVEVRPPQVALVGVAGELEHAVADRVARGLVPGRRQQDEERRDLGIGEPLAVHLGLHEGRTQIVTRVAPAVHRHRYAVDGDLLRDLFEDRVILLALELAEDHIGPTENPILVLVRDAHHRTDDLQRQRSSDLSDDVAAPVGLAFHHSPDDGSRPHPHRVLDHRHHLGVNAFCTISLKRA